MKKIMLLLALVAALVTPTRAQTSDTATVAITLEARYHAYIIAFTPKDGDVDKQRYINQVVQKLTVTRDSVTRVDSAQAITVTVRQSLVPKLYETIGSQQERLTAEYNRTIMYLLFAQLQDKPELLARIMVVADRNTRELETIVNYGFDYLRALK